MSFKTLKLGPRPQGSVSSLLYDPYADPGSKLFRGSNFPTLAQSNTPARSDTGILDSVISMISSRASDISMADITTLAAKLKMPVLIILGIAAAAAIIYLVYKVYTNREPIGRAINEFIEDIKRIAPDLTRIPGWLESIKHKITNAFQSKNPASAVSELAGVKAAVIEHQKTIGPVGSGIDFFDSLGCHPKQLPAHSRRGAGLKVPM